MWTDVQEFARICKDLQGSISVNNDLNRFPRICKDLYGFAKMCKNSSGSAWICDDFQGFDLPSFSYSHAQFYFRLRGSVPIGTSYHAQAMRAPCARQLC